MFSARERAHGIHAGDYETSVMLALRPDLVRLGEARDFESAVAGMERDFTWLRATPPVGFGWMSNDLNEFGALGNAAIATAEKGEACADYGATAFIELLEDVAAFDLTRLTKGPLG
jgi:creatinine amidohydrolase